MSNPYSKTPYMMDHPRHNLNNSEPLPKTHRLAIVYKGTERAVLSGDDLDALKDRAATFARAQGWKDPTFQEVGAYAG